MKCLFANHSNFPPQKYKQKVLQAIPEKKSGSLSFVDILHALFKHTF